MKFVVLDDFPMWTTYLLGLLVLCGFLFALTMLIRSLLVSRDHVQGPHSRRRGARRPWFFVIAGAVAVWFLGSSMYLRFHAVGLDAKEIELIFFWPRPPLSLGTNDLVDVHLQRAHRGCGHLEVATRQELFRSVNFRKCDGVEEILRAVAPNSRGNS